MLSLLIKNNVDFLVVGAYALAMHGFPRATADIDIFVDPNPANASRLFKVLVEFGAPLESVSEDDFCQPDKILQIGVAPRRIDIITTIDGLSFAEAALRSKRITLDGLMLPVISKQDLIINKLATGRAKDRLDAFNLSA